MKDGINYERRTMLVSTSLLISIAIIIFLGLKFESTSNELNILKSQTTTKVSTDQTTQSYSDKDYEAAKECFGYVSQKLNRINDILLLVGSGGGDSYNELVSKIADVKKIADGGTILSLANGTSCPSID